MTDRKPYAFKLETMADKIADAVLADLTDRSGFDAFWSDIDGSIRQEIRSAIGRNALEAMLEATTEMEVAGDDERSDPQPEWDEMLMSVKREWFVWARAAIAAYEAHKMTHETRSLEELIAAEPGDTRRRRMLIKMLERVRANG